MATRPDRAELTRAALDLAARGWRLFPLRPATKVPAVRNWEQRATRDPERIRRCWAAGPYNIGVATGPSGLVVIDLDTPKPDEHPSADWARLGIRDGADVLATLAEDDGARIDFATFTVRTRRGGLHLYYTAPDGAELRNTSGTLGWLIDTRAAGGYVVGPGSLVHAPDGTGHYVTVHDGPAASLPAWLADRLRRPIDLHSPMACDDARDAVSDRDRYAVAALHGEIRRVLDSPDHAHNHALNKAAYNLGRLVAAELLAREDVERRLCAVGEQVGRPHPDKSREVRATVASGIDAGMRQPLNRAA